MGIEDILSIGGEAVDGADGVLDNGGDTDSVVKAPTALQALEELDPVALTFQ